MKKLILFLFLAGSSLQAQNALYVDISGKWRLSADDQPVFAQPGFDDSTWKVVELPWHAAPPRGVHWLRRTASLPVGTDTGRLALTLGSVGEAYEVYINGAKIGTFGGFSNQEAQVARPRTFDVPAGIVVDVEKVAIAIRIWKLHTLGTGNWIRYKDGPYLLTYAKQFPATFGSLLLRETQWSRSPDIALGALQALLAFILLTVWLTDRQRMQFLWLALFLMVDGWINATKVLFLSPDSFPWSWRLRTIALPSLSSALFAEFNLTEIRRYSKMLHLAIVVVFAAGIASRIGDNAEGFVLSQNTLLSLSLCLIAVSWWRNDRGRSAVTRHSMAALLLAILPISGNRTGLQFGFRTAFRTGEFEINATLLLTFFLALFIVGVLLRELLDDRRERARLATELEAARTIQQLLLPQSDAHSAGWRSEAVYEPALEVGGDFYWSRGAEDGSLTIAVGDVSGKGLRAAMLVSVAIGILRTSRASSPAEVLAILNEGLAGHTGGGFVTCCCARFDADGTVTIASAGHPAPYCDGREVEMGTGLPLGVMQGVEYAEGSVKGRSFTLVSDGVFEAENAQRELFGFDRTRAISGKAAQEIAEAAKAWGQNDDITVVTVRRSG